MGGGLGGGSSLMCCEVGCVDGDVVVGDPIPSEGIQSQSDGSTPGSIQV